MVMVPSVMTSYPSGTAMVEVVELLLLSLDMLFLIDFVIEAVTMVVE